MDIKKALEILVSAVKMANQKGAYTLEESAMIAQAVAFLSKPIEKQADKKEETIKKVETKATK